MDIRQITTEFSVSPQITPEELAAVARQGFRSIICNRPDGEGADQPGFDAIAAAAQDAGITARYLPVTTGNLREADVAAFGTALSELPQPVLAYCRSGTRAAMLWALSESRSRPLAEILTATETAGYDMTSVLSRLVDGDTAVPATQD